MKKEEAILGTGSMFDLVYIRALIQGVGMERTNKAGALSALRMAPSRALPTRKYTKRGKALTEKTLCEDRSCRS